MKDQERPPVPPLGDSAIARIERGVFAELDLGERGAAAPPSGGGWRRRSVAALAAAAVGAFAVAGVRELRRGGGAAARDARIATAASPSHLTIEGAAVDVAPSSAISFGTEHDGTTVVRLERGAVTCEVAPRSHRAPFVVEAGSTRVTVIGTRFSVRRAGDHASVSVEHGTVEVGDDGLTQLVHAGERYRPGDDHGPGTVAPVQAEAEAEARVTATAPAATAPATVTAPAPGTTHATAPAPATVAAPAPATVTPPATATPTATAHARRAAIDIALATPARTARPSAPSRATTPALAPTRAPAVAAPAPRGAPSPAPSPQPPLLSPPPPVAPRFAPVPPSLQRRFEIAAGMEMRDPEGALRIYADLSTGGDAWAANALFASGRLEAERRHHDGARALLEGYLERFPRGANAADARALLVKLDGLRGAAP